MITESMITIRPNTAIKYHAPLYDLLVQNKLVVEGETLIVVESIRRALLNQDAVRDLCDVTEAKYGNRARGISRNWKGAQSDETLCTQ